MAELKLDDISFLQGQDDETIHKEMLDALPDDLDKTEGGFPWDFTKPTALRVSKYAEQDLLNAIACIFPIFSFGEFLDWHGDTRSMARKSATKSYGRVQVVAKAGTEFPVGTLFSTKADDADDYVEFVSIESGTTESDTEAIELPVEAVKAGKEGNVSANSIILLGSKISGVKSVNNAEPTTGGTDEESDDSYRDRIVERDRTKSVSYVGSPADYKRWALEVPGTGYAEVIPAQDDSGLVTIILTDANGDPANEQLCEAVYNHIQSPGDEDARLSNVNALLSVIPPATVAITISATVELVEEGTLDAVKEEFMVEVKKYLASCGGEVKYSQVYRVLSATTGLNDHKDLLLNGAESNIKISTRQLAEIESVTFIEGVVE